VTIVPQMLLIAAVIGVGILHTIVPDHWVPITLLARAHGWSRAQTARAALQAGTGHVVSTLVLGLIVWAAGAAFATSFGHYVSLASSAALIAFGAWIAIGSLRELREGPHGHEHEHELEPDSGPNPPAQEHRRSRRTALLLILGSSPMVEGIPAFFAAGRYGFGLIVVMALCFAAATIATYVGLCVFSTAGLQHVRLGAFEKYGEVASGAFIAAVGLIFLFLPLM
jgi:hypothetical protein